MKHWRIPHACMWVKEGGVWDQCDQLVGARVFWASISGSASHIPFISIPCNYSESVSLGEKPEDKIGSYPCELGDGEEQGTWVVEIINSIQLTLHLDENPVTSCFTYFFHMQNND